MHPITTTTKNTALHHLHNGESIRKTAEFCGISKSKVHNLKKTHLPNLTLPKSGRPTKLSAQDKRFCVRSITSGGLKSSKEVANKLNEQFNIKVSASTIRNTLHEAGLKSIEKQTKPKLSPKNIKARLQFANIHKDWTIEDWKKVIWSDETKINRFCSDGRSWSWIRDGESLQPHHVKQTVKYGGGSIMIWGCMTYHGVGYMCKIDGIMNQHIYKEILEDELLNTIDWYDMEIEDIIFQQDNDPKHTAKSVQKWLDEQAFQQLDWPPQSPDLNPIENLWAILKKQLNKYDRPAKGMIEHWERVQAEWNKIEADVCVKLVESMPKRIKAVIKAKGMWTDY
jgi:transposase